MSFSDVPAFLCFDIDKRVKGVLIFGHFNQDMEHCLFL